jgi:hypothetical protein
MGLAFNIALAVALVVGYQAAVMMHRLHDLDTGL